MKKRIMCAAISAVLILSLSMAGCGKKEDKIRSAIEKFNQNKIFQVDSESEQELENGVVSDMQLKMVMDKEKRVRWEQRTLSDQTVGDMEVNTYYGEENGETYYLYQNPGDKTYFRDSGQYKEIFQKYMKTTPIELTEKTKLQVLGEEKVDGNECIKVKLTTSDFKKMQEDPSVKAMYDAAKQSEKYKEDLEKAEEEYMKAAQETIVWVTAKGYEPVKAERDTTLGSRFLTAIINGYANKVGTESTESAQVKSNKIVETFRVGKACEEIKVPTEYSEVEY